MMLSETATYALRAALYLAHQEDRRPVAADAIALALGAPAGHMSRTLEALAAAGVVSHTRGAEGGFRLLVDPMRLTVARVLHTFNEPLFEQTWHEPGLERREVLVAG